METLGYFLILGMGMTLGLIGAGGSILTIPILVYLFHVPTLLATTYSLFIVGTCALLGALRARRLIIFKRILIFVLPSVIGVALTRFYLVPYLPTGIGRSAHRSLLMVLLAIIMFIASYFMIKEDPLKTKPPQYNDWLNRFQIMLMGLILGGFLGLLGAGGGFLIVPILVILLGIPIQQAVATSLLIITLNSLVGFLVDQHPFYTIHYKALLTFTGVALCGMWLGSNLRVNIPGQYLKKSFGWLVVIVAITILFLEFFGI